MKHYIERFEAWSSQVEPETLERVVRPLRFLLLIPFQPILWPLRKVWSWAESSSAPKAEREFDPEIHSSVYWKGNTKILVPKPPPLPEKRIRCVKCGSPLPVRTGTLCDACYRITCQPEQLDVFEEAMKSATVGQVILTEIAKGELIVHKNFLVSADPHRYEMPCARSEAPPIEGIAYFGKYFGQRFWSVPSLPDGNRMMIWKPTEFNQVIPGVLVGRLAPGEKMTPYDRKSVVNSMTAAAVERETRRKCADCKVWDRFYGIRCAGCFSIFAQKAGLTMEEALLVAKRLSAATGALEPKIAPIAWVDSDMSCVSVKHPDGGTTVITIARLFERWGQPDEFVKHVNARQSIERSELQTLLGLGAPV